MSWGKTKCVCSLYVGQGLLGLEMLPGSLSWGMSWGKCMCFLVGLGLGQVLPQTLCSGMSWGKCMCSLYVGRGLSQVLPGTLGYVLG